MFDLTEKVIVVTGGGAGIGKAISCAVAAMGATAVIADRDWAAAENTADEIRRQGLQADAVCVDVSNSGDVAALLDETVAQLGGIDVIVNNAGVLGDAQIWEIDDVAWRKLMAVNLDGVFYCCRESARVMKEQGYGHIINIASAGGKLGFPYAGVHYCSSKGAVMAMTRQLALQVASLGIRVNAVAPGTTKTEMVKHRSPQAIARINAQIPLGRMGMPEDTAAAVVFLASDVSGFITGETVDVNGGLYMA